MKLSFDIDTTAGIITLHYHENPTFAEIEKTLREILLHRDYKTGFDFIIDRSRLREGPSAEYIEKLIKFLSENEEKVLNTRWAIIVSNALNHGMVRMAQILATDKRITIKIFRNLEEGRDWLRSNSTTTQMSTEKKNLS